MPRWPGGLIRKTPVTPAGPYQDGAAPGVWTLAEAAYWTKQGLWPIAGNAPSWIGRLSGSYDYATGVAADAGGNVYVCGVSDAAGSQDDVQIAKYDASGVIQWQRRLYSAGGYTDRGLAVAVDAAGNVHVSGRTNDGGTPSRALIAKYNTSGTLQWQKTLYAASTTEGLAIAVDSGGNVYVCGVSDAGAGNMCFIAKYDTSGAIQWQRTLGTGTNATQGKGVAVDASGNVYISGFRGDTYQGFIAKYNTSGAIQWQRVLGGYAPMNAIALDSSANVYVGGDAGAGGVQFAKYDTSGTIQWQRQLTGGGYGARGVAVDTSGNVYSCGSNNSGASTDFEIAKYNTSGTIQWQRRLGGASGDYGNAVFASGSHVYVCGEATVSGASSDFLFAKLPDDGSLTGTYSVGGFSVTYAVSTLTDAATSLTDAAGTLLDAAGTLTSATPSLASAASTLTSSVTTI